MEKCSLSNIKFDLNDLKVKLSMIVIIWLKSLTLEYIGCEKSKLINLFFVIFSFFIIKIGTMSFFNWLFIINFGVGLQTNGLLICV